MAEELEKTKNHSSKTVSWLNKFDSIFVRLQKVKLDEKIFFTKNLKVMIKSGLSVPHALKISAEQTRNKKFKTVLINIKKDIESGSSLAKSFSRYPEVFSEIFVNMIEAGERSGQLDRVLEEVAMQMKQTRGLASKVKKAMAYPVFIMFVMIGVGIFVLGFIIPKMTSVFFEMGIALPLPTRILIATSNFVVHRWYVVLILVILLIFAYWKTNRTKKGKYFFHSLNLKMPIIGSLYKKINIIKFSRTFSSLLVSGISLVQTFQITSRVLDNVVYREKVMEVPDEISKGVNISAVLERYPSLFPVVLTQMIAVGEKTGTLDSILEDIIAFYEDDVDETLTNFTSIIEPVLIVLLGIGVAVIALAILMPMYSLTTSM